MDTTYNKKSWILRMQHKFRSPVALSLAMILPALLLFLIFYFYPIIKLIPQSLIEDGTFTFQNYIRIFTEPLYYNSFLRTVFISLLAAIINLLLGYPIAYTLTRVKPKTAKLIIAIIMISFWTSLLVRTYSWMVVLQRNGIINNILVSLGIIEEPIQLMYTTGAVLVGIVHILLPFMILPIYSVLKTMDPSLKLAAMSMGATRRKAFFHVTLPLSVPGIASGIMLVFIQALGFYVTPMLLGGPKILMVSGLIDKQMFQFLNWGFGSAIGMLLLLVTILFLVGFDRFFGIDSLQQKML